MHTGIEKCFAVKAAPQSDSSQPLAFGKRNVGKILLHFVRREIDVCKHNNAAVGLFQDLGSPTRFVPRIESLPALESKLFQYAN